MHSPITGKRRNLNLPNYLHKRKLQLLRSKILVRKFWIIWYKKAVSKVLPSVVLKHRNTKLKRNYLRKLHSHWFYRKNFWKLQLRADLHYEMSLKYKVFRRLQCYALEKKRKQLLEKIADGHYELKLKTRCLLIWRCYKKYERLEQLLRIQYQFHIGYVFLKCFVVERGLSCMKALEEYYLKKIHFDAYRKRQLKFYFRKLKSFAEFVKDLRYKIELSDEFFSRKYGDQYRRKYFQAWVNYVEMKRENFVKFQKAIEFLNFRLKQKYFLRLLSYTKNKQEKNYLKDLAQNYSSQKIIKQYFRKLLNYTKHKLEMRMKICAVENHYKLSLLVNNFYKLLAYKNYKQTIKAKLEDFSKNMEIKLKQRTLKKLLQFKENCIKKKQQIIFAENHVNSKLLKKHFFKFQVYVKNKIAKKIRNENIIKVAENKLNLNLLRWCFDQWKAYKFALEKQNMLMQKASLYYARKIETKIFAAWKLFVLKRKQCKLKIEVSKRHYNTKLLSNYFQMWHQIQQYQKQFRDRIKRAKEEHRKMLLRMGITAILEKGIEMQNLRKQDYLQSTKLRHEIAYKYFKKWKLICVKHHEVKSNLQASNKNKFVSEIETGNHKLPILSQKFNWDPDCFLEPKIPDFLK